MKNAQIVVTERSDEKGIIYLGMNFDDVRLWLDTMDIWYEGYFTPTDPNDLSIGYDGLFTVEFSVWTDTDNKNEVYGIAVLENIPTMSGLNLGDSLDIMIELYGDDYIIYQTFDGTNIYEYDMGSHYFQVNIFDDKVDAWKISKSPHKE